MLTINRTDIFDNWFVTLKDLKARTRIAARIKNTENGNFGDHASVGAGVYEMRVDVGAGYRVYYYQQASVVYLLMIGGDKKTQSADIAEAIKMKKTYFGGMMTDKIEIKQFDAADYLDSEEAIAEYLDAIMEENPALYNAAMRDVEKARQRLAVANVQAPIALAA